MEPISSVAVSDASAGAASAIHRPATPRAGRSPRSPRWMVAPGVVLVLAFLLIPIVLTFTLAFTNAKLVSPHPAKFIGFDNFTRLFADNDVLEVAAQHRSVRAVRGPHPGRHRARPGAAGQREGQGHQLLPDRVLPAGGHLHGRDLHAVAVHVPDRTD